MMIIIFVMYMYAEKAVFSVYSTVFLYILCMTGNRCDLPCSDIPYKLT